MGITNKTQFISGKGVESWLDGYFTALGWRITQTTPHEERVLCIGDRRFNRNGQVITVEYKSGIQTGATGNIFLETMSVDTQQVPGWVYTCKADYILYAALLNDVILVFKPCNLRTVIDALKGQFREVSTSHQQNDGYNTRGVIVPLEYAKKHLAEKVISL